MALITKRDQLDIIDSFVVHLELTIRMWFFREVMQVETYNPIVLIPIENISPRYRDDAT